MVTFCKNCGTRSYPLRKRGPGRGHEFHGKKFSRTYSKLWPLNFYILKLTRQQRASATSLVISGFGLSAFIFSTLAHSFFPGDTSSFLLLLALGTALPMLVGLWVVKPILEPGTVHDATPDTYEPIGDNEDPLELSNAFGSSGESSRPRYRAISSCSPGLPSLVRG